MYIIIIVTYIYSILTINIGTGTNNLTLFILSVDCKRLCGDPPAISNGLVNSSSSNISITYYTCENGYILSGSGRIDCNGSTGHWSPPPSCQQEVGVLSQS